MQNKPYVIRANGVEYFYAYRGGPRVKDPDTGEPLKPGTSAFDARVRELQADRNTIIGPPDEPTIKALISEFRADPRYKGLAASTRAMYERFLASIDDEFGAMRLRTLSEQGTRATFLDWRNGMAETPRMADYAWSVSAVLRPHA